MPRELGECGPDPASVMESWLSVRDTSFPHECHESPLFVVTGSAPHGLKQVSPDSWRKVVNKHFNESAVGTHSFRRGGAAWYVHEVGVDEQTKQSNRRADGRLRLLCVPFIPNFQRNWCGSGCLVHWVVCAAELRLALLALAANVLARTVSLGMLRRVAIPRPRPRCSNLYDHR